MAAVDTMTFPARNIFEGYPYHCNMNKPRIPDLLAGYHAGAFSHTTPPNHHSPTISNSPSLSTSSLHEHTSKPSLPSISNLLGIANADRSSKAPENPPKGQQQSQALGGIPQVRTSPNFHRTSHSGSPAQVHDSSSVSQEIPEHQPVLMPSAASLRRNDLLAEGARSPSTLSSISSLSTTQPHFVPSILNSSVEVCDRRNSVKQPVKRLSVTSQPDTSPLKVPPPYTNLPYAVSPGAIPNRSYYSPTEPQLPMCGSLHVQRPLPSNFPPPPHSALVAPDLPPVVPTSNPWEHHHYISPSSQASFPPSPDRYICQTCNKAFSRPSSLKIHSHSHTGEKPFRCPHLGCGKAFSVRSNMKRHERGCHVGQTGLLPPPHML